MLFRKNPPMACPRCYGAKRVQMKRFSSGKSRTVGIKCPTCKGRGTLPKR